MPDASSEPAVEVAVCSDAGCVRPDNEDHHGSIVDGDAVVIAVADGVSGYPAGATASRTAIDALFEAFVEQPRRLGPAKRLYRAMQHANIAVHDLGMVVPELCGMATTLTAVIVEAGQLAAAHVGDSRLYRLRRGALVQLTKDHTVVAERVRLGLLGKQSARRHADRSVLTRSLGRELVASIDQLSAPLEQGDALLLCSDGLYNMLDDLELAALLAERDANQAARTLVDAAVSRGAPDNVTAAVLRMVGPTPEPTERRMVDKLLRLFV